MTGDDDDVVDDPAIADLARAIADGTSVSWPASAPSTVHAGLAHQLRTVQQIANLHRSPGDAGIPEAVADGQERWWGHLKIVEVIGHGAFGDVYRAWDSRIDRAVALKIIRPAPGADGGPAVTSAFVEEARLLARVHHPNVLTVFGADTIDGQSALWTELIQGRTLHQLIVEGGPFTARDAAAAGRDVCRAVSAVHGAGLLHRDVKAQNVMRADDGRIVLMDFGAGHEYVAGRSALNPTGTPVYAAPEVLAGQPSTVQSDVYSLGILLYYLVTAGFPTPGTTVGELVEAHREGRYRRLRDVRPELPADFIEIVERAIEADPERRFQTAGALEAALSGLHRAMAGGRRSVPWPWIGVSAGVAAGVLALFLIQDLWRMPGTTSGDRTLTFMTNGFARPAPDGRFIAHVRAGNVWLWDTRTQRDVRQVTQRAPDSMEGAEGGVAMSFDGTQVAHVWKTAEGARALRIIRMNGTNPRTILLDDGAVPEPIEWSRDGRSILTVLTRPGGRLDLVLVPTTPGTPVVLQTLAGRRPKVSLSPDGQYVVYDAPSTADRSHRHLMIARTDGSPARVLLAESADAYAPFWTPDGRHVLFISTRSGPRIGWLLPVTDGGAVGEPEIALRTDMTDADPIALTKDGQYYYWLRLSREVFTREIDAANGARPPVRVPAPSINGHGSPGWSPDGRHIAFVSGTYAGAQTLAIATLSTQAHVEVPLLLSEVGRFASSLPQWTPDAQFITIRGRDAGGQRGYFNVDVKTGQPTPVVVFDAERNEGDYGRFRWLPDGRFVYEDRQRGLIARTPAGEEIALFPRPGLVSPVDFSIASSGPVAGEPMNALVIHRPDGTAREVFRVPSTERIELHAWSADGRELILTTRPVPAAGADLAQITAKLLKMHVADATIVDTGVRLPVTQGWVVAVSPDGRRIAYEPVPGAVLAELHVAQGFLPPGTLR